MRRVNINGHYAVHKN